jgi:hypothetical protein
MALETTKEYQGDTTATTLIALFCCLPYGIYSWVTDRKTMVICPQCRETADPQASTCPHCNEDFDQHR